MTTKSLEKFNKASLKNLSNNLYKYLKQLGDKRVNIKKDFDFEGYKEAVRMELVEFSYNYNSLATLAKSEKMFQLLSKKSDLKDYVDEIIDNEEYLNCFTIYKIQQFINRVARNLIYSNYNNFEKVSKDEKYLLYKDIELDLSKYIGFITEDKIITYLYDEFGLKRLKQDEYSEAIHLKNVKSIKENSEYLKEIDQLLFKAATDVDEKNQIIINHPVKDNNSIMNYIRLGAVAEKLPSKILRKKINADISDITF